MNDVSLNRILLLHPKIRAEVLDLVGTANKQLSGRSQVLIVQGLRTIDQQNELYAQGRTKPGKIVTKAKGGSSYHNYGLAIDFALLIDNKTLSWDVNADFDNDHISDWMEVVKIFKDAGYEWGGNWKTITDMPHLQKTFGYNWRDLLKKYNAKDFIPHTEYVNI
jgi:peptidoglycan L-alanyl-D-glutamate endopeptidase CwlK